MSNNIVVLKFGGTSMGSAKNITACVNVIRETMVNNNVFIVVSASSKMTDYLLELIKLAKNSKKNEFNELFAIIKSKHFDILKNLSSNKKENLYDKYHNILENKFVELFKIFNENPFNISKKKQALILSFGEDLSSELMECALIAENLNGKKIHSKKLIKTNGDFLSAHVNFDTTRKAFFNIQNLIEKGTIFVMTGFFGSNFKNEIMLLGRGGSDFSASIAGISLNASKIEIWSDENGIMSSDPKIVERAISWNIMNKDIASEMAKAGAKILHPKTMCASHYNLEIVIKNLFNIDFTGTKITPFNTSNGIKGIIADENYSIIHLENKNIFGNLGFVARIGLIAEKNKVNIDMLTTSERTISFTIKFDSLTENIFKSLNSIANVKIIPDVAKISIIGENIINSNSIECIFKILNENNINPLMVSIGQSNNNIGIIINKINTNKTLKILHKELIEK